MNMQEIAELIQKQLEKIIYIKKRWQILKYDKELQILNKEIKNEYFWQHKDQILILQKEKKLSSILNTISKIEKNCIDCLLLLKDEEINREFIEEIEKIIETQKKEIQDLHLNLLLHHPEDTKSCYLDINSGAGGTESQDWAYLLLRMYTRFCEKNNFYCELIDSLYGEETGIKSATLFIKGNNATGMLSSEIGIHRLVRISPFDAKRKRHTSFAAISITPEVEDIAINIDTKDLRIDTYRAGGAGGQHVNKTDSAVRITHIPSGIVVQCQNERSQLQNKEQAMKILRARLYKRQEEEREIALQSIERKKIEWGSQIRSYVLHPYKMVKDHRTEVELYQPDDTLDGNLLPFIEAYLLQRE